MADRRVRTTENPSSFASFASSRNLKMNLNEQNARKPSKILRHLRHCVTRDEPRRTFRAQTTERLLRHLRHLRHSVSRNEPTRTFHPQTINTPRRARAAPKHPRPLEEGARRAGEGLPETAIAKTEPPLTNNQ